MNKISCFNLMGLDLKRSHEKVSPLALRKNASLSDLRVGMRTFNLDYPQNKLIEKFEKIPENGVIETRPAFSKSKSEALIDIRIKSYLNSIRENRKFNGLPEELIKNTKRKALKVRIRKGNNSHLIK